MDIEYGIWNYYLTFRLYGQSIKLKSVINKYMFSKERPSGIIAYSYNETIVKSNFIDVILAQRSSRVQKSKQELSGNETENEIFHKYSNNELPEEFFDINDKGKDLLASTIEMCLLRLHKYSDFACTQFYCQEDNACFFAALMPYKVYTMEHGFFYCPVYVMFFNDGSIVAKIEIPFFNIDTQNFSKMPLNCWFDSVKVWAPDVSDTNDCKYKLITSKDKAVTINAIVRASLEKIVANMLKEQKNKTDLHFAFETIELQHSAFKNLNLLTSNYEMLRDLISLANPGHVHKAKDKKQLMDTWRNSHIEFDLFHILKGNSQRLVLFADKLFLSKIGNNMTVGQVFHDYMAVEYDVLISTALAQKDSEISTYYIANQDPHIVNKLLPCHYRHINLLESLLMKLPDEYAHFYNTIKSIINNQPIEITAVVGRISNIEEIHKNILIEKTEKDLRIISIIFTAFFGLPLIRETFLLLKTTLLPNTDMFPIINVNNTSVLIWALLLIYVIQNSFNHYLDYWGYRPPIGEKTTIAFRAKQLLRIVKLWFCNKNE